MELIFKVNTFSKLKGDSRVVEEPKKGFFRVIG